MEREYTLEDLFHGEVELPSFPPVLARLNDMLARPTTTMEDVSQLVETEPSLAARILKLVNSPLYRAPNAVQVADLKRAVTLLGVREIQTLATTSFAVAAFSDLPNRVVDMRRFWRHSLYTGLLAQSLGRLGAVQQQGNLFVAGLLHDLGSLLIYSQVPTWALECINESEAEERPLDEVERDIMGFDHATAGGVLLRRWRIPELVAAAAEYHHRHPGEGPIPQAAAIVRLANALTGTSTEAYGTGHVLPATEAHWEQAGLNSGIAAEAMERADEQFAATEQALMG